MASTRPKNIVTDLPPLSVNPMNILGESAQVNEACTHWRTQGKRIAFVPTMGNLHDGHLALVSRAASLADHVVVSIFVNPMQFGQNEDFDSYPRTLQQDIEKLTSLDIDLLFTPANTEIYPDGPERTTFVEVPGLSDILCGEFRPAHFRGVTTVVNKLFNIVQPHTAVFGEKDYQQLAIIRRMVKDTAMPVEIEAVETVREHDGLAMSSRNRYLEASEREKAARIYSGLERIQQSLHAGSNDFAAMERKMASDLQQAGFKVDYVSIRDAENLHKPNKNTRHFVILAAAWLGKTRLIDNVSCAL